MDVAVKTILDWRTFEPTGDVILSVQERMIQDRALHEDPDTAVRVRTFLKKLS